MPAKSKNQFKFIQTIRSKYKDKESTPEKYKWVWDSEWTDVDYSELRNHVRTFVGGGLRDERHPSYQAWSYASHLQMYNEYVYTNQLQVNACAYLHNCMSSEVVGAERYSEELGRAPVFIKGEIEGIRRLIRSSIKTGVDFELL